MIKKIIYILILIINFSSSALPAPQNTSIEYNIYKYVFKDGDISKFRKNAESNMLMWENSMVTISKAFYLKEALRYYFLLSQADTSSIDAQIGLGRVYDEMKLDKLSQKHFFTAYNMDNSNPKLNLHFGDYYFKRNDLVTAFSYYDTSYKHGYDDNYYLNYRMGVLHEKLGDLESAKKFYKKAVNLDKRHTELANKIRLLDDINYSKSQYYLFGK